MDLRILRLRQVINRTGLSRSTIYAEIAKGKFPKQRSLTGGRSIGWREDQIIDWIDSRK